MSDVLTAHKVVLGTVLAAFWGWWLNGSGGPEPTLWFALGVGYSVVVWAVFGITWHVAMREAS